MNTAQIAIEQLLAGCVALALFGLPFARPPFFRALDSPAFALALLGIAYLIGVVFDKLFDEILKNALRWIRIGVGAKKASGGADLLPQDRLEAGARAAGDGAREWMSQLRTRLRLTRMLAVATPLLGVVTAQSIDQLAVGASADCGRFGELLAVPSTGRAWLWALWPTILFALAFVSTLLGPRIPRSDTSEAAAIAVHLRRSWLTAWYPLLVLDSGAVVAAVFLAQQAPARLLPAGFGLAIGAAAAWAWTRLVRTYLQFLVVTTPEPASH
jgi:hypothetical protein